MIVIARHGYRAPFDSYGGYNGGTWTCDLPNSSAPPYLSYNSKIYRRFHVKLDQNNLFYKPSCSKAELTVQGQSQHYSLGQYYRKVLIEDRHFLTNYFNPSEVSIRSSSPDRCVKSAISFLNGFYPAESPDDIVEIVTGTDDHEALHPRTGHCPDIDSMWDRWLQSSDYIKRKSEAVPYLRAIDDTVDFSDENQWLWIGDWLYTIACCSDDFPSFVNQTQFDYAIGAVEFFTIGFFQYTRGVAGASTMRVVLDKFEKTISQEETNKFSLMTGHDVTIVAVLNLLGVDLKEIPPFRSHLAFERWEVDGMDYIRVVLNGDVVVDLLKYNEFKVKIAPYLKYCSLSVL
ncbi:histidine acid phosphatase [Histomonas meleagridis]|uniref:histidine acid phosphatase n=1 Tax=Histomonas meleagridis TaxID=135588 RepID=UPI0035597BFD|nr:histidine acid phosphatase [Histomonas meleagridis]KAH0805625.1 histidine acid phosphatase [Histomonas meleagridis]